MNVYDLPQYDEPVILTRIYRKVLFEGALDGDLWGWSVRSHSNPFKRYTVTMRRDDGRVTCNCMDFQCRKRKWWPTIIEGCIHCHDVLEEAYAEGDNEHE